MCELTCHLDPSVIWKPQKDYSSIFLPYCVFQDVPEQIISCSGLRHLWKWITFLHYLKGIRRGGWVRSIILSPVCFPKNKWTTKSSLSLSGCQRPWVRQDFYTQVSNLLLFWGAHQVQCNTEWILFSFMLAYLINMAINQSCFAAEYPGFWNFNLLGLQIRSVLSRGESGSLPTWTLQVLLSESLFIKWISSHSRVSLLISV